MTIRTRSLAVFAAGAAVMLVAIAAFVGARAAAAPPSSGESFFVPQTPCRLFDTRPEYLVGSRATPIGAAEEVDFQVTGEQGNCDVPAGATAVSINVTAVGATQLTDLRIWPANASNPGTSFMNPSSTSGTVVNKVDVGLSPGGAVTLFNAAGSVHVIGDVLGYYTDAAATKPFIVSDDSVSVLNIDDGQTLGTVVVELDRAAQVFVSADAAVYSNSVLPGSCSICNVGIQIYDNGARLSAGTSGGFERLTADAPGSNLAVSVATTLAAGTHELTLRFKASAAVSTDYMHLHRSTITAIVVPTD